MNLRGDFEHFCRLLGIPEALLLRAGNKKNGGRKRLVAAYGVRPSRRLLAAMAGLGRPLGEFRQAHPPGFRSKHALALEVPLSLPLTGPAPLLVVGLRRATSEERQRAQALASHLSAHYENVALRERVYRLAHAATLGELVFQTAHEINNPLANVIACADLLDGEPSGSARAQEAVSRLKSEADRALEIARGILSLARSQQSIQTVDWTALVRRALELRAQSLRLTAVKVKTQLCAEPLMVRGHAVRLLQAILNILLNAEQALEQCAYSRQIVVRTERRMADGRRRHPQAVLEIANNGPQVPPEVAAHMFDPFFTTKPSGQGTGLGLPMARAALAQAGGILTAENLAPGELFAEGGVRFRLALSAAQKARAVSEAGEQSGATPVRLPQKRGRAQPRLKGSRILVVEDERALGRLLKEMLRELGCRVQVCASAEKALAETVAGHYDLVIADLKLPGHSGSWLLEQLRRSQADLARRVLFITGDTISQTARRFLRASGRPVLAKPFHLRELTAAVENLLAARRRESS